MKQKLVGNDKVRLIRLNQVELETGSKHYASIVFWGDLHLGHPQCDTERAKAMLDYCLHNHIYVLCMGDQMEAGLRTSVGDSVYQQLKNPQDQMEAVVDMLSPLAKANLILGIHSGNHELRIQNETGVNPTKIIAKELGITYLDYACWHLIKVGQEHYTMYSTHGVSGSRFKHTKLKAAVDIGHYFEADIIAMAHVHEISVDTIVRQRINLRNRTVEERKVHIILTGSYLTYDKSYAQMKSYPPSKLGSPKIQLYGDDWDIHASV